MLQATPLTRQILKCIHLTAVCTWIGSGLAVLVLLGNDRTTSNGDELFAFNHAIRSIDNWLIKPAAMVSSISGLFLCGLTSWGFARHRWIVIKGLLTLGAILFGALCLGPWLAELSDMTAANRIAIFDDGAYARTYLIGTISSVIQTLLLVSLVLISIVKPSFVQKRSFSRRKTWDSCFAFISRAKS